VPLVLALVLLALHGQEEPADRLCIPEINPQTCTLDPLFYSAGLPLAFCCVSTLVCAKANQKK
jgi:hypothetical protein